VLAFSLASLAGPAPAASFSAWGPILTTQAVS
jgi:hypothetical protein